MNRNRIKSRATMTPTLSIANQAMEGESVQQTEKEEAISLLQSQPKKQRPSVWSRVKKWASKNISKAIVFCLRTLNRFDRWVTTHAHNPNPNNYEDLAPSGNIEEETTYFEALQWALRNNEITNIALTGPYGSGKSSILKSFQAIHKEFTCLNISLATFSDNPEIKNEDPKGENKNEGSKGVSDEERKLVELSILQQLFYKVKDQQIPDSRFKRIKRLSLAQQFLGTIGALLWLAALVFIIQPDFFNRLSWWNKFYKTYSDKVIYTAFAVFVLGIALFIFSFARIFRNTRLNKLNITSGEMEIGKDEQKSILNKYLDEILYFFEATSYNVVIIEDLDRFNDTEIFTKLREINTLINNSGQINRRVVFIYAIKDEMFVDKSRAKFFDFIIPVIPVINSSNSIDILRRKLTSAKLSASISEEFISDITLYIDDMRMLKNVVNEYIIYKDKIGSKLNQDKLLGMIIYKNLYPKDFAELHSNEGMVHGVFVKKTAFIKAKAVQIAQQISELEAEIEKLERISLKDLAELRAVYIAAVLEVIPQGAQLYVDDSTVSVKQLKEDKYFNKLLKQPTIKYYHVGARTACSFKSIEDKVDPEHTYEERAEEIRRKSGTEINELKSELEKLRLELSTIQHWSLSEVLQYKSSDSLDEQIAKEKLLVYLLRYGYIDEMYHSYISYFYEGSITKEDMDYVLSVKNGEALGFDFQLTKVGHVLKKLRLKEFEHKEVLNFFLVDYLFEIKPQNKAPLNAIIRQLTQKSKITTDFLEGYRNEGKHVGSLIAALAADWEGFWEYINTESSFSAQTKSHYLVLLIKHANLNDLIKLNGNGALATYITKREDFLSLIPEADYTEKIKELITLLNIKFEGLVIPEGTQSLFDHIYANRNYKLNPRMIELVIRNKRGKEETFIASLRLAHYTTVLQSGCTELISYIEAWIDTYITNVFLLLETNTEESEEVIINLLNNDKLSLELKEAIIQKESAKISDISEVADSVWTALMTTSKLMPTWHNVYQYLNQLEEPDTALVGFLNREENYTPLGAVQIEQEKKIEDTDSLQENLLLCADLTDTSYKQLVNSVTNTYDSLDFGGLSPTKVDILIQSKKLTLSEENYKLLRKKFRFKNIALLEVHAEEFLENLEDYTLEEGEYELILSSPKFTSVQKATIIQHIDDGIITSERLANIIGQQAFQDSAIKLNAIIMSKVFALLSTTRKIKLLTTQINHLQSEDITRYLQAIGNPYALITTSANPVIDADDLNIPLAYALKSKDYISSYRPIDDEKMRIFTKKR